MSYFRYCGQLLFQTAPRSISRVTVSLSLAFAVAGVTAVAALAAPEITTTARLPEELKGVGITERLGERVNLESLRFRDENGADVSLSSYFGRKAKNGVGKPVILSLVYYECPNLCTMVLSGLLDGLKALDWSVGDRFDIVSVSINPKEKPQLASLKKQNYLKAYARPEASSGWTFLTGEESQIRSLADQVGFGYRYDEREQQYAHGAAIFVLTPEGRISRVLYGVEFKPTNLKLALLEASDGKIGTIAERFLLFCYRYDPLTRTYSVTITRVLQLASMATVLLLGGYLAVFWRRQRPKSQGDSEVTAKNAVISR